MKWCRLYNTNKFPLEKCILYILVVLHEDIQQVYTIKTVSNLINDVIRKCVYVNKQINETETTLRYSVW